jgi:hypothetical protein
MAKYNRNSGKPWTANAVRQLQKLAGENTPTRVIGLKLGRTEDAVRTRASDREHLAEADEPEAVRNEIGCSLRPRR